MKSIFCTAYAAPVSYYKAFAESDLNLLEFHEHFVKQSIRNRCEISTAQGILILSIPISNRKNNMPLKEVCICYKTNWQRQHLKSLITAYQSSPFFEYYVDDLKKIYVHQPASLIEWNNLIHQQIVSWLKLKNNFEPSSSYIKVYEETHDFRNTDWKKQPFKSYHQVFESKLGFIPNLSIFDLLFNSGNQTLNFLRP